MRGPLLSLALAVFCGLPAGAHAGSLRFLGLGLPDGDRVVIPLDAPSRPVDVGGDFTLELFVRLPPGSNATAAACSPANDAWIAGHIAVDRDVFGPGDVGDFGLSFIQGRVAFGVSVGDSGATACGSADLRDGRWHHLALTRHGHSGDLRIFLDGTLDGAAAGPPGDIAYRNGRASDWPHSDPFLVLGSEKHFGPPAFAGAMDELRLSRVVRYAADFVPLSQPFASDADTVALYGFDEGSGLFLGDRSGAAGGPSDGLLRPGGDPAGPVWSSDSAFDEQALLRDGFEATD